MKNQKRLFATGIGILLLSGIVSSQSKDGQKSVSSNKSSSTKAFLGRWDITLKAPEREYPSWLQISAEGDQLRAQMVGRWGNARPLPRIEIANGKVTFVSPKEEEAAKQDMVFEGKIAGKRLVGAVNGPDGNQWSWVGERAPSLKRSGTPTWGKPVQLFNGKDLTGWKPDKENPAAAGRWKMARW